MSDGQVREALEQMEAWLSDPQKVIESAELTDWNRGFFAAVDAAERGPGWPELVQRAHGLSERLSVRTEALISEREAIRKELESFARGNRALRGYQAGTR